MRDQQVSRWQGIGGYLDREISGHAGYYPGKLEKGKRPQRAAQRTGQSDRLWRATTRRAAHAGRARELEWGAIRPEVRPVICSAQSQPVQRRLVRQIRTQLGVAGGAVGGALHSASRRETKSRSVKRHRAPPGKQAGARACMRSASPVCGAAAVATRRTGPPRPAPARGARAMAFAASPSCCGSRPERRRRRGAHRRGQGARRGRRRGPGGGAALGGCAPAAAHLPAGSDTGAHKFKGLHCMINARARARAGAARAERRQGARRGPGFSRRRQAAGILQMNERPKRRLQSRAVNRIASLCKACRQVIPRSCLCVF